MGGPMIVSPPPGVTSNPFDLYRRRPSTGSANLQELVLREACRALDVSRATIDLRANFIELGGHSLSAIGLASACKSKGVRLSVESILLSDTMAKLLDAAKPLAHSSLDERSRSKAVAANDSAKQSSVNRRAAETSLSSPAKRLHRLSFSAPISTVALRSPTVDNPMTEMQLSLIHGSQANPGTNIISFFETYHTKDIPDMQRAWQIVIESEPIFRTAFDFREGKASLLLQPAPQFSWVETVVHDQDAYDKEIEESQPDMEVCTSFKVVTWHKRQTPAISTIIWRVHHALIDGYSAAIIYKKLRQAVAGCPVQPGISFAGVARQLQALQDLYRPTSQQFWKQRQEESLTAIGDIFLPPPPAKLFSCNATKSVTLSLPVDQLARHARQTKVSLASMYHAAWAMALSMYNDSDSVVFGVVLSGRNLPFDGVEDAVGPLINTLPLHVILNRSWNTTAYLRYVFNRLVELSSVQFSRPEDGYSRKFTSALATEFEMKAPDTTGVQPVGKSYFTTVTDIPLSIFIGADNNLRLCYHCNSFGKEDVKRLGQHYRNALYALMVPQKSIGNCMDIMLTEESQNILRKVGNCISNQTLASSVHDDLVTIFERAALEHPDAVAVEKADQTLTYQELHVKADQVARHLSQFIQPGEAVCVNADRSVNWIVAIYGILKAGGVYSPQDKALPAVVRNTNFQSAGASIFLVSTTVDMKFKPTSCERCFAVEELLAQVSPATNVHRKPSPTPSANAYMCFTSGSTGKPKGVICTHEGLVAFQRTLEVRLFAAPGRKISQIMSPAFDGSIHEIFSALSYGATLVLSDSADPFSHLRLVDSALLTPSIAKNLVPEDFPRLSTVYLVGEPVPQHVNDVWAAEKNLYNMYGPTEATCGATIQKLRPGQPVSIGAPNPSTRIYILNRNQRLTPPGVVGEIYLAGVQVARGYISRPDETASRFLVDSNIEKSGERMYRTGDRGYWNSFGEVQCLGRNDRQIKLRGFRLDLNDLEIRIAQAVPLLTAVAIAQKDDYLVALVQPSSLDVGDVRSRIAKVLQIHALPRLITAVDEFPMTPIGKVDYKAIPAIVKPVQKTALKPVSSPSEAKVVSAWREALGLGDDVLIDGDSNFITLGGHSLAQLLLVSQLSTLFRCQIPFSLIAQSATLHDLAQAIDGLKAQKTPTADAPEALTLGEYMVSPMEREWWQKYELNAGSSAFNVSFACVLDRSLVDVDRLTSAWNMVIARHRILRCRYISHARLGVRRSYSDLPPRVQRVQNLDVQIEINLPFDLQRQHPIRVTVADNCMVAVISHIICDLTTLQVLLREVQSIYSGSSLPSPKQTYMETTLWNEAASPSELGFWSKYLENAPTCHYNRENNPDRVAYNGASRLHKVSTRIYRRLVEFTAARKFTLHQLSLAAVALALQTNSQDTDIMLGGPYLNRPTANDLETVGLFLEPLPIRVRHTVKSASDSSSLSLLQSVQTSSQSALSHAVPWTQLLHHLKVDTDFPNHPLLETMVTFHGDPNATKMSIAGVEPLLTWTEGSKFKLLAEFCAISEETLLLRLEYDTRVFSLEHIRAIERMILEALECLLDDVPIAETKTRLRKSAEMDVDDEMGCEVPFGVKLTDL